ncbi:MAG: hypothetical protein ACJASQ_004012 [Crocinitomicaceae bacterium]|jgi:hypothetical protein
MKEIEDLTEQLILKIADYKIDALEGISDGERYRRFKVEDAYKCVEWNYKKCGYRSPVIIITENPLEMQMMFNFIKTINGNSRFSDFESKYPHMFAQLAAQKLDQFQTTLGMRLRSISRSKIGSRVSSNLNSNFIYELDSQLYIQLYSKTFSQLDCQLGPKLSSELGRLLRTDLRHMLGDQLGIVLDNHIDAVLSKQTRGLNEKHLSYLFTSNFYSDCIYAWYEFLRKELQLELSINQDFQECFKLQKASGICQAIYSEELCVISKYPKQIHWNQENQLHNKRSQAIEWGSYSDATKLECVFVNGEAVSSNLRTTNAFSCDNSLLFPKLHMVS